MESVIFNKASDTPQTDSGKPFQSLVSALNHDTQYAGITRTLSTSTNDWWQGAVGSDLTNNTTTSDDKKDVAELGETISRSGSEYFPQHSECFSVTVSRYKFSISDH